MNLEIAAKWVAALRSGAFEQGHGMLKNAEGKYCCLGVLQELVRPGSLDVIVDQGEGEDEHRAGEGEYPDDSLLKECGFVRPALTVCEGYENKKTMWGPVGVFTELAVMNDGIETCFGDGKTFAEIADHIEANAGEL
jgi:hypothetical protein